ncbi:hypothetical protein Pd630_LPD16093 (plasmid) [Rhodococcus opacus PD630]|nr:hypothetical protein Pd630_LPD16093 [Rhodococcus opacus PD630]
MLRRVRSRDVAERPCAALLGDLIAEVRRRDRRIATATSII